MSIKKLAHYLEDADITLRSDHLPFKEILSQKYFKLRDKAKHTAALIQERTEELQAIEEEYINDEQDLDATQESDLEQEDSDNNLGWGAMTMCNAKHTTLD